MEISLKFVLYFYLIFLFFWSIFSFFNIFHVIKFGTSDKVNIVAMAIYIIVSFLIIGTSFVFINNTNWEVKVDIISLFI